MSTIAGYTICFLSAGRVRLFTMAVSDDSVIDRRIVERFGKVEILSRTPLDAKTLGLLKLKRGEWVEWAPLAHGY